MGSTRRIISKYSIPLPILGSVAEFVLFNPYFGLIYYIVSIIFVTVIQERLLRKQLYNVFIIVTPYVSTSFLQIQCQLPLQPVTDALDLFTSVIFSMYMYRCWRQRHGLPIKLEPFQPMKINLTIRCPKCGTELKTDAEFCPQCGTKLPTHSLAK